MANNSTGINGSPIFKIKRDGARFHGESSVEHIRRKGA